MGDDTYGARFVIVGSQQPVKPKVAPKPNLPKRTPSRADNARRWAPAAYNRNYAEVKRHQVAAEQQPPPPTRNLPPPPRRNTPTPPLSRVSPMSNLSNNNDFEEKELPPPPPQRDYSSTDSPASAKPFYI